MDTYKNEYEQAEEENETALFNSDDDVNYASNYESDYETDYEPDDVPTKQKKYIIICVVIYVLLAFSNGVINFVMKMDNGANEITLWLLNLIEHGIGICCFATIVISSISSIVSQKIGDLILPSMIILLINLLMPFFVKSVFIFIIAVVIMIALGALGGWRTIFFLLLSHIDGTFGTVVGIALLVGLVFASSLAGAW